MDVNGLAALWSSHRSSGTGKAAGPARRRWATVLLLTFLTLDLAVAAFFGGRALAQGLTGLDPRGVGALLWRIPLALGVAGALWEGGCLVDPRPFRPFFIQDRTLVLAEFLLGLTTPAKGVLGGLGLAFSLGLATVHATLLPWGLLYTLVAVFWVVCLERIVHGLAPGRFLRQRAFLLVVGVLGGALAGLGLLAGGGGASALTPPPALGQVWNLPGTHLLQAWQAALAGHPLAALGRLGPALAVTALLGLLTWAAVLREFRAGRSAPSGLGGGRCWAFARPWPGVAWIQFHQVLGSPAGQMRLVMLLLTVVMVKEPELISVGHLEAPRAWAVMAGAIIFGSVLAVPLCNLLGFDRGGVRTWWILPIRDRELWLGKVLGTAAYGAVALVILLALLVRTMSLRLHAIEGSKELDLVVQAGTHPLGPAQILALALFLVLLFVWWAGSGLHRSLAGPWPMGLGSYGVRLEFDDEKVARFATVLAPLCWMAPLYALADHFGPWALFPLLGVLGIGSCLRFRTRLDRACQELAQVRETVTSALLATP